jgi:hypothetical protein
LCVVSLACAFAVFVVNLSYPEWTGGWSTGPRLLVPLLPFAMIPVAAVLAGTHRPACVAPHLPLRGTFSRGEKVSSSLLPRGEGGRRPDEGAHSQRWLSRLGSDGPLWLAAFLAAAGAIMMLLYQGVGARIPQDVPAPLRSIVWPLWNGSTDVSRWWTGERFTRNATAVLAADWVKTLPESRKWCQFLPLVSCQLAALCVITRMARKRHRRVGR